MKTILLTALWLGVLPAFAQMPDSADSKQKTIAIATNAVTTDILERRLDNTGAFHVTFHLMLNGKPLIKSLQQADHGPDYGDEDIVIDLNADGKTITYSAKKRHGLDALQPLTIDFSNKQEIEALSTLLTAYNHHVVGQPCGNFARDEGGTEMKPFDKVQNQAFASASQAYQGAIGKCVGLTDDYGSLRELPDLRFRSSQGTEFGLPEPLTLLYIINHQSGLWQMRDQAIAKKHEADVAAQQLADAAAKAKELEQEQEKKQAEAVKEQELEKKEKAKIFMDSVEGQTLLKRINSQWNARNSQYEEEAADIIELQKQVKQLLRNVTDLSLSADDREAANEQSQQKQLQLTVAKNQFKPSDKLQKMTDDLKALFDEFQSKAGVSYDDAMKYRQAK